MNKSIRYFTTYLEKKPIKFNLKKWNTLLMCSKNIKVIYIQRSFRAKDRIHLRYGENFQHITLDHLICFYTVYPQEDSAVYRSESICCSSALRKERLFIVSTERHRGQSSYLFLLLAADAGWLWLSMLSPVTARLWTGLRAALGAPAPLTPAAASELSRKPADSRLNT